MHLQYVCPILQYLLLAIVLLDLNFAANNCCYLFVIILLLDFNFAAKDCCNLFAIVVKEMYASTLRVVEIDTLSGY